MTQGSVAKIPLDGIELPHEALEPGRPLSYLGERWRTDEDRLFIGRARDRRSGRLFEDTAMGRQVTVDRTEDGALIVPLRLVPLNPRQTEFFENRGDVLVLELDRAVGPADPRHEDGTVMGLDVAPACQLLRQHGEIVGDDLIQLVVRPRLPDFLIIRHAAPGRECARLPVGEQDHRALEGPHPEHGRAPCDRILRLE